MLLTPRGTLNPQTRMRHSPLSISGGGLGAFDMVEFRKENGHLYNTSQEKTLRPQSDLVTSCVNRNRPEILFLEELRL